MKKDTVQSAATKKEKKGTIQNVGAELRDRGMVQDEAGGVIEEFLAHKRKVYLGMDPTADSLHVGHLVPIMLMRHLANAGHELLFIIGGGTGMIGDPRQSGERVLLDLKTVAQNKKALNVQLARILGGKKFRIIDNYAWLSKLTIIEFLRDIGKHFTVNQLLKREIIKKRIEVEEDPISYTEFSYSLLQGYDFLYLHQKFGIDMQIGGSDQWANILSGIDLIRRKAGKTAYALTTPIITDKKTGKKFGKSEGNAVWLDPKKTSSYIFYQFWLNVSDEGVEDYLKIFTFLPLIEISNIVAIHKENPNERIAQRRLAHEVTKMIHGESAARSAALVSGVLFGEGVVSMLTKTDLTYLLKEVPMTKIEEGTAIIDVLVALELAASKGEARRLIEQKGVSLNETLVSDVRRSLAAADFLHGIAQIRRGKKIALVSLAASSKK